MHRPQKEDWQLSKQVCLSWGVTLKCPNPEIYSGDENINPIALCGNTDGAVEQKKAPVQDSDQEWFTSDTEENHKAPNRWIKGRASNQIVLCLDSSHEKVTKCKVTAIHDERKAFMNRFLTVLQKSLKRLRTSGQIILTHGSWGREELIIITTSVHSTNHNYINRYSCVPKIAPVRAVSTLQLCRR